MRYQHIVRAVSETPWAIRAERLAVILELVAHRAGGGRYSDEEIEARIGAAPARRQTTTAGAVAVIPLAGVLVPKANLFTQMSGGTSVQQFGRDLAQAVADPRVDAVLIDIDSPGGMTDLIPEVAAQIRDARDVKPVVAIANTDAGSAAYWLGAQAGEFVVTPSGLVGSIGVFAAHDDISAKMEQEGVTTTLVSAGRFKTELSPFEPLSNEARDAMQARVDTFYGMFVADVAAGRRVTEQEVREGFGEGRMVTAAAALAGGMVDRVDTFDSTLARLATGPAASHAKRNAAQAAPVYITFSERHNTTQAELDAVAAHFLAHGAPPGQTHTTNFAKAASSGLSFADEAEQLTVNAARLVERASSLAEVERGHLTVTKRERLSACPEALRHAADALEGVLAATARQTNDTELEAIGREHVRLLAGVRNLQGGQK